MSNCRCCIKIFVIFVQMILVSIQMELFRFLAVTCTILAVYKEKPSNNAKEN